MKRYRYFQRLSSCLTSQPLQFKYRYQDQEQCLPTPNHCEKPFRTWRAQPTPHAPALLRQSKSCERIKPLSRDETTSRWPKSSSRVARAKSNDQQHERQNQKVPETKEPKCAQDQDMIAKVTKLQQKLEETRQQSKKHEETALQLKQSLALQSEKASQLQQTLTALSFERDSLKFRLNHLQTLITKQIETSAQIYKIQSESESVMKLVERSKEVYSAHGEQERRQAGRDYDSQLSTLKRENEALRTRLVKQVESHQNQKLKLTVENGRLSDQLREIEQLLGRQPSQPGSGSKPEQCFSASKEGKESKRAWAELQYLSSKLTEAGAEPMSQSIKTEWRQPDK